MKANKKIKIGFFHCSFVYSGGGERIALEGVLGLRKRGYEVDLYSPAVDFKNCYPELLKKTKPRAILFDLPRWVPLRDAIDMGVSSLLAPLVAYKFRSYDIFIGENQPGTWFAWVFSKIFNKPYVIYLNQPNRLLYPRKIDLETGWHANKNFVLLEKLVQIFKPVIGVLDRASIRGAYYMTTNGSYIGKVISKIYKKDFISCPAGCDPFAHGRLNFSEKKYFAGKIKINKKIISKPYTLLTNRHYPQKRFDLAIKAFAKVVKKYPKASLVIGGGFTSVTKEWKKLAKDLSVSDKVVWLNEVPDEQMANLIESAAVYVYSSPEEDYGMGVVEAQEMGVPPVAWNNAGPTVTIVDGKTGFLVKPNDIVAYARKILWLLNYPKERIKMGKAAHAHVRNNFTWKHHVDILEKAVKDSLS